MDYERENQRLKQESMDEILTTLTANRLLPWPAWWNKHSTNLENQQQKKSSFFLAPFESLCWRPNYRANTVCHLIFLYISPSITLLAARISFTTVFLLGKCSLIQLTPPTSGRLSSLSGLMLWFCLHTVFIQASAQPRIWAHLEFAPTSHKCPRKPPPSVPASYKRYDFGHRARRQRQRIHLLTWVTMRLKLELN